MKLTIIATLALLIWSTTEVRKELYAVLRDDGEGIVIWEIEYGPIDPELFCDQDDICTA